MKSQMFEAVVLMGGFGTRLKSLSNETPKPMMPVGGAPFVYLLLKKLEAAGCKRIIYSLHYKANEIIEKIKADSPVKCESVFVIEDKPLGTGGALKLAANSISESKFIALNGDTYSNIDYGKFYTEAVNHEFVISGINIENAERYGSINYDDKLTLTGMKEKGFSGPAVINSGTYLITKSSLSKIEADVFSFEDFFIPRYFQKGKVSLVDGYFIDIGIPEDYQLACKYFQ